MLEKIAAVMQPAQVGLVIQDDFVSRFLNNAAAGCKKKRRKRLYRIAKQALKRTERKVRALKLLLNESQFGLDR